MLLWMRSHFTVFINRAIPIAYGGFLMCLVLYKFIILCKEAGGFHSSGLIKILTRNQVVYFLGYVVGFRYVRRFLHIVCTSRSLIIVGLLHIASELLQSVAFSNFVSVAGNPSLLAILNARILFDMKERGNRDVVDSSVRTASTVSEIVFGDDEVASSSAI